MDGETNYKRYLNGEMTEDEHYNIQLKEANEFQDFVCVNLIKKGIVLSNLSSKKYQNEVGENLQGFEIKHDNIFRETGNLYIEIFEKKYTNNKNYIESGIYRMDNSWIYAIGDYKGIFLMQKTVLIAMHKKNRYKTKENIKKSSIGMLLPISEANKYFNYIEFKN